MKKILTILFILMLIISVFQISDMYAKYKTEREGEYESLLGVWSIKLNDIDISSGESMEFELTGSEFSSDPNYVKAGKVAPGTEGYFDLQIDPTGTDVAVIYEVTIQPVESSDVQYSITSIDNVFKKVDSEETIENTQAITSGEVHKGIMPLDKINGGYINYIRVNFSWPNVPANDVTDTQLGSSGTSTITIPISVDIKQYMGETLE